MTLTLNAPGSHPGNKVFSIFFVASWVCFGCLYFEFNLRVRSMMASYLHHERVTAVSLAHGVVIMNYVQSRGRIKQGGDAEGPEQVKSM